MVHSFCLMTGIDFEFPKRLDIFLTSFLEMLQVILFYIDLIFSLICISAVKFQNYRARVHGEVKKLNSGYLIFGFCIRLCLFDLELNWSIRMKLGYLSFKQTRVVWLESRSGTRARV